MNYLFNKNIDLIFVQFPVIFPIIYGLILYLIPNSEIFLIFFTILLLAEPHFGATWTIFFDEVNYEYFDEKKNIFYYGSIFLIFICLFGFFFIKALFFLIFYAFNIFHVTRQSAGISKLYNSIIETQKIQIYSIYFFNIIFFFIGLFRFYIPLIQNDYNFQISVLIFLMVLLVGILFYLKSRNLRNTLIMITGMLIFYPICFVDNPIHAILMGVTMHYSQYLAITLKVYFGRNYKIGYFKEKNLISIFKSKFFLIIFLYGFFMSILSATGKLEIDYLRDLIIIPIIGQMLHFYLDSFLWKFSESHNRKVTLKYIKNSL